MDGAERRGEQRAGRAGVLICGAYGMRNAGDEAVLDAILAAMREIDPAMPVTVLSRDPAETAARHGAGSIPEFGLLAFWRALRRTTLFISGGGSLIQDATSSRSLWYYLYTISAARRRGCRVMMYGCGVGPVSGRLNRRLAGRVIDRCVDAITVRETASLDELRALGVTRPEITLAAEPALTLAPAPEARIDAIFERHGMARDGRYFCLCIRRWPGVRQKSGIFAAAAEYARERYGLTPVLLSVNIRQDSESACRVREKISGDCVLVTEDMSAPEIIGFLGRMKSVMAMRLHALIFSAARSVPLIGISYDPKVAGFLDYISQTNYIDFDALCDAGQLRVMIDAAMEADREAMRAATARLAGLEARNRETAKRLLAEQEDRKR
ncbi:MAG: polysaccharide pyruvyl transferase CsaB [Oscillospiraceae bacterium]|nr:polysaccharide pyruvyl transferase CsaB [Oscillospiraceae bacterium]